MTASASSVKTTAASSDFGSVRRPSGTVGWFLASEVGGCGSGQLVVQRQVAVGVLFDVHVHVDRDQRVEVEAADLGTRCLPVAFAVKAPSGSPGGSIACALADQTLA